MSPQRSHSRSPVTAKPLVTCRPGAVGEQATQEDSLIRPERGGSCVAHSALERPEQQPWRGGLATPTVAWSTRRSGVITALFNRWFKPSTHLGLGT